MTQFNRFYVAFIFTGLFAAYTPVTQAYDQLQQQGYDTRYGETMSYTPINRTNQQNPNETYGDKIGKKALSGWTNLSLGMLEIPKNMINTTNQSNVIYGVIGGLFKGLIHTGGRMGVGIADLITFPLPTKPIAYPAYIWDDFDVDTTYGDTFRLDKSQPVVRAPEPPPVVVPARVAPRAPEVDRSSLYNQNTSRQLDTLFKERMKK